MYQVSNSTALLRGPPPAAGARRTGGAARRRAPSSCSGSRACSPTSPRRWSSTVLPLYLVVRRRLLAAGLRRHRRPLQRRAPRSCGLASGFIGDRFRRHKEVARPATACRRSASSLLASSARRVSAIGAIVLARPHRQGHPHRAARRDDLAVDAARAQLGAAFGVHRALDTTGAMIGPLLAFAPAGRRAAGVQLGLPRQLLHRAHRRRRARAASSSPRRARDAAARRRSRALAARRLRAAARPALPRAADRRRRAEPRDRQRRLHLPRRCRTSSTSATSLFPLLFVGSAARLHGAGGADGPAGRPLRPRPRLPRRLRAAARRLRRAAARRSAAGSLVCRGARRCSAPTTRRPTAC